MPVPNRRSLILLFYALALFSFVSINLMLGYYVYMELRAFNVVITGADRTAKLPGYERSLFRSPYTSDDEVEAHVRRRAFTDLVDKIDDLGQTIRLLIQQSSSASGHIKPDSVALVTPITSKGKVMQSEAMPLFSVSLPSLCDTASAGYHYTYFLCYTQGDAVFGDASLVQRHFDQIKQSAECKRWREAEFEVDFVLVEAGPRVTGRRGLSILFNLPTLHAFAAGYEFFYLVNDDLRFVSPRWTEVLTDVLRRSSVMPYFGITGGLDISSPQHFAEFPFFHRRHVHILGDEAPAHPYVFHNWWEDNWMTDIYIPWNSSYYRRDVLIKNYAGLEEEATKEGAKGDGQNGKEETMESERREGYEDSGGEESEVEIVSKTEPRRYEAVHDNPPAFYIREVERARAKILRWLTTHLPASANRGQMLGVELEYCRNVNETLALYANEAINPCRKGKKKPDW